MPRRRTRARKEVSLFPFLDILGCLIGSLILIITTVVLEQMDTAPVAEAAKIDDLRREAARETIRRDRLEQKLAALAAQAGPAEQRLSSARSRAEAAARAADEAAQKLAAAERMPVETLKAPAPPDIAALEAKRKQLEADAVKNKAEIMALKKPPEQSIVVLPPGSGAGPRRGVFVEAAKGKAVVHDPQKPWEVPQGKVASDPRLKELFTKTAADKGAIITFLTRPDGIGTYQDLDKAATAAGVRTGRVPLPGAGVLDLSEAR